MDDLATQAHILSIYLIPLVLAITMHEAAHALVADKLGDPTARQLGRVSLNPLVHVDPVGTLVLPGILLLSGSPFLFGWAKPVPVRFGYLRHPRRDMALVALAGPGINIVMAFLAGLALHLTGGSGSDVARWISGNLVAFVTVNVVLAVFNMMPLLPMDGGRVLNAILPTAELRWKHAQTEKYGLIILLALLFVGPLLGSIWGTQVNLIDPILRPPVEFMFNLVVTLTGSGIYFGF
ncbi:MAG TPA: site-2 protease family protein [Geminicoccus sp.]|uniref:site-2 protease family protein n=1 Tax=Geminicoccus sp. TaxID=2024832 RepID=UPI002E31148C|nr:site-2 protease family protein [Geminicoccus sp.]HEX2529173.1 site-2 protease family protein [Geminicoccus sp.]